jgi:hypothetical protein
MKITLDNVEPAVWRRVVVSDSLTFGDLHDVIQRAMGWQNAHMHQFELAKPRVRIGSRELEDFMGFGAPEEATRPEYATTLAEGLGRKRKLRYWYDFGDDWWHTIAVEKRLPADTAAPLAELVDGAGACPPEDCGGPWGYGKMLATVADPANPGREELLEWLGEHFDPAAFDLPGRARAVAALFKKRRR